MNFADYRARLGVTPDNKKAVPSAEAFQKEAMRRLIEEDPLLQRIVIVPIRMGGKADPRFPLNLPFVPTLPYEGTLFVPPDHIFFALWDSEGQYVEQGEGAIEFHLYEYGRVSTGAGGIQAQAERIVIPVLDDYADKLGVIEHGIYDQCVANEAAGFCVPDHIYARKPRSRRA